MSGATVYLMPVSFGYGPAALAVGVAEALRRRHPALRVCGVADGLAREFLLACDAFAAEDVLPAAADQLPVVDPGAGSVWVGFADFDRLGRAVERGYCSVMVDPLFWMWASPPALLQEDVTYLALRFPGIDATAPPDGLGRIARFRVVPQVVESGFARAAARQRRGYLLNLGGGIAPGVDNLDFLQALVDVAHAAADGTDLLVASSAAVTAALTVPAGATNVSIRTLDRREMIEELSTRARLITVPGQSIIWEALTARIPTVVVPGSNYSQHRQSVLYREEFRNVPLLGWDELPGLDLAPAGLPESDGLAFAAGCGHRFAGSTSARATLQAWLRAALQQPAQPPDLPTGSVWRDLDGAEIIADEIAKVTAHQEARHGGQPPTVAESPVHEPPVAEPRVQP